MGSISQSASKEYGYRTSGLRLELLMCTGSWLETSKRFNLLPRKAHALNMRELPQIVATMNLAAENY